MALTNRGACSHSLQKELATGVVVVGVAVAGVVQVAAAAAAVVVVVTSFAPCLYWYYVLCLRHISGIKHLKVSATREAKDSKAFKNALKSVSYVLAQ